MDHTVTNYIKFDVSLNATLSNISAVLWRPVLVVEEAGVSGENNRHGQATGKLYRNRKSKFMRDLI
jgi:hypothetical protein